ncbi:ribonuclease III [Thermodesulfobacteriota bacterium]
MDTTPHVTLLEERLSYQFKDQGLLSEALCHSSYANENPGRDLKNNERLEFLGDAVLNLVVGHLLIHRLANVREGHLSRMRARLVNETQLAAIARGLDLGSFVLLGKGEVQTKGHEKASILADALEAVVAAIYLDGGFAAVYRMVERHFSKLVDTVVHTSDHRDFKTRLQELAQATHGTTPTYRTIEETGPDHEKTFVVQLEAGDLLTEGVGRSKKTAEQNAARQALRALEDRQQE